MKRTRIVFLTMSLTVIVLMSTLAVIGLNRSDDELFQALGNLAEVVHLVQTEYVDELHGEALLFSLDAGIVESVDPWGAALPPSEVDRYRELVTRPPAFGLALGSRLGSAAVRLVMPGSPAEAAGIEAWEVVELVNGVNTRGRPLWQILFELSDAETTGEAVTLTMIDSRVDERRETVLEPGEWTFEPFAITSEDGVQIVDFHALGEGTADRLEKALDTGSDVILDLRNLAWGLEDEALRVADLFANSGVLGHWVGRKAGESKVEAEPGPAGMPKPIALVGANTEGVGEILAAALKRAGITLVGARTLGHAPHMKMVAAGEVTLWIPVASWMLDDETTITENGVQPDETVEAPIRDSAAAGGDADEEPDPVLDRALELLTADAEIAA